MRVGIVGSRSYQDQEAVFDYVRGLPQGTVIVSGGCAGVDTWAADAAKLHGLAVCEHLPVLPPRNAAPWLFTRAYHARNLAIVADCNYLVAFTDTPNKGGTGFTIKAAKNAGRLVTVHSHIPKQGQPQGLLF